jgi:hypothetical protein
MPWFTCPTCQHKTHATGPAAQPCTNPKPCRGTMTADPPRQPAEFGPTHVAERTAERERTQTSRPPPVAAAPPLSHEALLEAGLVCPCGNSDPANCPSRDQHRADYERAMETVLFFAPIAAGRPGKYKLLLLRERTDGDLVDPPSPELYRDGDGTPITGLPLLVARENASARVVELESQLATVLLERNARVVELERQLGLAQKDGEAARAGRATAERHLEVLEADGFHARKPDRSWWACPDCGPTATPDEDGCCAICGRDCAQIHAWDSGDTAAGGVSDVRVKLPDRLGRRAATAALVGYLANVRAHPWLTAANVRTRQAARDLLRRAIEAAISVVTPDAATARSEARTLYRDGWAILEASGRSAGDAPDVVPVIDVVLDGPPGHEPGRFVEVEDASGRSIDVGVWIDRGNGMWALRLAPGHRDLKPDNPPDVVPTPPIAATTAAPPTSRALAVIADMREVADLCSSGGAYGDEVRPTTVLGTLAAIERRLTEAS